MRIRGLIRVFVGAVVGFALPIVSPSIAKGGSAPANFRFVYETGFGTRIDSHAGSVTKDLVGASDTTIRLILTGAELNRIYRKMIACGLFELSEPHPAFKNLDCNLAPSTTVRFRVAAGIRSKTFEWETAGFCGGDSTPEWDRLIDVIELIQSTVNRRPEYKRLPEPRGAYG